jgi:hypothetical protein
MSNLTIVLNVFRRWKLHDRQLAAIAQQVGSVVDHVQSVLVVDCRDGVLTQESASLLQPTTITMRGREIPVRFVPAPGRGAANGVWGRIFAVRDYVAADELVAMFDDDTFPAPWWLEACWSRWQRTPALYVGCGIVQYNEFTRRRYGWPAGLWQDRDCTVDWGCHAWFGPASLWAAALLNRFKSPRAGEDMALSFAAQRNGLDTIALPPTRSDTLASTEPWLGRDRHALYRRRDAAMLKVKAIRHYRSLGWLLSQYYETGQRPAL